MISRALLSVSDKRHLSEFAQGLCAAGVELVSTGGTRKHLEAAGLPVTDISDYTGFPEMMDGRLKTLHPKVHGGILGRRDNPEDLASLAEHGILPFELVVVNLYPFAETIARPGVTRDEAIEQIDIGGPTMVRAAAKNHPFVTIATQPEQYAEILRQVRADGDTTLALRRQLAGAAYEMTARYDRTIADWWRHAEEAERRTSNLEPRTSNDLSKEADRDLFPPALSLSLSLREVLRYGENPHQPAALYALSEAPHEAGTRLVDAQKLHGKELSYNNLLDLDSALAIVQSIGEAVAGTAARAAAVVIKHNNPCGVAAARSLAEAARRALDGDPVSAFGSILSFNQPLDAATAEVLAEPGRFVEAIVAPGYDASALDILTTKPKWKANVRLLALPSTASSAATAALVYRQIDGGLLAQQPDVAADPEAEWQVMTEVQPSDELLAELRFAWAVCRHVKSNAIVVSRDLAVAGVGAGQMSRVDSVEIAIRKAGERVRGAVLASDAFFPFEDSIQQAAAAGIAAVIQPGGSKRDAESIAAANQHRLPMIFTGRRHFRH